MLTCSRRLALPVLVFLPMIVPPGTASASASAMPGDPTGPFKADWQSLITHEMPQWLVDAKFGIYAHWGVYSVPAFETEWYAKRMYEKGGKVYQHHVETYGDPSKFGYKDFVPLFRAENYDPEEWANLVAASGARYAGIAVVHHDGFLLWDSDVSRWNAGDMGPHRDLYGDLVKSLRSRGLKIIATEHHMRTYNWYLPRAGGMGGKLEDPEEIAALIRQEGWDLTDPEYADFYWNQLSGKTYDEFLIHWQKVVREVIDKYQPDILWFDGGNFRDSESEQLVLNLLAYYHNRAAEWGKPVEVLNKLPTNGRWNFVEGYGIATYEEGRDRKAGAPYPWIDDMKIADKAWCYVEGQHYKSTREIVAGLCDRVARGGGLLLNLSPRADGTIPEGQRESLLGVGRWLKVNGEAIYGSRPWVVHSEGDDARLIQKNRRWDFANCTASDIRFTRPGDDDTLYCILLGWPGDHETVTIKSVNGTTLPKRITSVGLLGDTAQLEFSQRASGLDVVFPEKPDGLDADNPCVLKINLQ